MSTPFQKVVWELWVLLTSCSYASWATTHCTVVMEFYWHPPVSKYCDLWNWKTVNLFCNGLRWPHLCSSLIVSVFTCLTWPFFQILRLRTLVLYLHPSAHALTPHVVPGSLSSVAMGREWCQQRFAVRVFPAKWFVQEQSPQEFAAQLAPLPSFASSKLVLSV